MTQIIARLNIKILYLITFFLFLKKKHFFDIIGRTFNQMVTMERG